MALVVVFIISLVFAGGMLCGKLTEGKENVEKFIAATSLGAMAGVAFLDLLPEIIEEAEGIQYLWVVLSVFVGFILLTILDHFVPEHEGHEESEEGNRVHIGIMSAIAIMLHNIVEGMTVFSVASDSIKSGISLAIGVGLHNIPMGAFIYSSLKGESRGKRNCILFLSSFSTFLGGLLMMGLKTILSPAFFIILTSLALGMVLFILCCELLPSAFHSKNLKITFLGVLIGLGLVVCSMFFE